MEGKKKEKKEKDDTPLAQRISEYFVNDGPKIVFIFIWLAGNISFFAWKYITYRNSKYHALLGDGISFSKGAAGVLSFNSALMLVTMLRNFLSGIRSTFLGNFVPVDKNIIFHRYMGWTIAIFAFVHVVSHMFNYNAIQETENRTYLGWFNITKAPSAYALLFTTIAGATGIALVIVMVLMYSSAIRYIRGPMFNVFWYTHHLFIAYFGLLLAHGGAAMFGAPQFWYFFIGPGVLYLIERTIRLARGSQTTILQLAIAHPSKVLELQMKKSTFKYKPGQYLFLNCPYLAAQEWHPFTISSAPEEEFVSVHIRIVGDWTGDLWNLLNPDKKLGVVQENLLTAPDGSPIFRIDGPFGAASEEVFKFRTVMLCAGGIGVTPFGSILKSIRYKLQSTGGCVIQKAYFYWISRDKNAFEWFSDLLAALEYENVNNFLEIHTYLTAQFSVEEIKNLSYANSGGGDQITGLQSPTHFGRPDWRSIFDKQSKTHNGEDIGVFFCGPAILSKQLYKMCSKFTSAATRTKFHYHKENF